jgi:CRISPR-associated protein Cmr5
MPQTTSQKMAQAAYRQVTHANVNKEYVSFSREFPTLVHTCGLAQAVAFAKAKGHDRYLDDLVATLHAANHPDLIGTDSLISQTQESEVPAYLHLSRDALNAANWLKRYVEATTES